MINDEPKARSVVFSTDLLDNNWVVSHQLTITNIQIDEQYAKFSVSPDSQFSIAIADLALGLNVKVAASSVTLLYCLDPGLLEVNHESLRRQIENLVIPLAFSAMTIKLIEPLRNWLRAVAPPTSTPTSTEPTPHYPQCLEGISGSFKSAVTIAVDGLALKVRAFEICGGQLSFLCTGGSSTQFSLTKIKAINIIRVTPNTQRVNADDLARFEAVVNTITGVLKHV